MLKAHSFESILSRNTSGSGSLSGNRSWTSDKDTVAKVIFAVNKTNAVNKTMK